MDSPAACDVSVIIPFTDDEEQLGLLGRRVALHLRALGARFEIIAVDEDSRDNSLALLALLRAQLPELRVISAGPRQGFAAGSCAARGRTLWLIEPGQHAVPLAPFSWAHARVCSGVLDLFIVRGRFIACRRTRVLEVLERLRGRGVTFERRLARRARGRRLRVETTQPAAGIRGAARAWSRVRGSIASARLAGFLRSRA